jgi:apolipoprotein D and lipocalin family protein
MASSILFVLFVGVVCSTTAHAALGDRALLQAFEDAGLSASYDPDTYPGINDKLSVGGNLVNPGRVPQSLILMRLMRETIRNGNSATQCPYNGFDSVKNFDLERYISAPWYVQKQIPIQFQPENTLYCVRAEYLPIVDPSTGDLKAITVRNYSNKDKVNGPATGTSGAGGTTSFPGRFIANVPNPQDPSKLNVGFALGETATTPLLGAPYWVVAIDEQNYQWAIITGGAPTQVSGEGKCITDGGFWLFSRTPVDPVSTAKMLEVAEGLGLDTAKLLDVPQEGCLYEGA